jgi:hypothetical protein
MVPCHHHPWMTKWKEGDRGGSGMTVTAF